MESQSPVALKFTVDCRRPPVYSWPMIAKQKNVKPRRTVALNRISEMRRLQGVGWVIVNREGQFVHDEYGKLVIYPEQYDTALASAYRRSKGKDGGCVTMPTEALLATLAGFKFKQVRLVDFRESEPHRTAFLVGRRRVLICGLCAREATKRKVQATRAMIAGLFAIPVTDQKPAYCSNCSEPINVL